MSSELCLNTELSPDHCTNIEPLSGHRYSMAFTPTIGSQLPLASGTLSSCYQYRDHFAWPIPFESPHREYVQNDCRWVAWQQGIDIDDLLEWNPSLSIADHDCHLQPGYSYCVLKTRGSRERKLVPFNAHCTVVDRFRHTTVAQRLCTQRRIAHHRGLGWDGSGLQMLCNGHRRRHNG